MRLADLPSRSELASSRRVLSFVRELVAYRELIQTLVSRDLKARYRGSSLGWLWTLLNPLMYMAIYTLVFSVYLRVQMDNFAMFLLCGMVPWIWFSSSLSMGASSIVEGGDLLKKVYFPPQVLPTVTVLANLFNFALTLPLLLGLLMVFGVKLGWALVALPILIVAQFAFTEGFAFIVAATSVRYRDIPHILGHLLTCWFFLSPIIYPPAMVPEAVRPLVTFNPMTPFLTAYQSILFDGMLPSVSALGLTLALGAVMFGLGALVFERYRRVCVEEI